MADIRAIASGNWSAGGTWNGGIPPGLTDNGFANGFTVTLDQDVSCLSINTTAGGGGVAGGRFQLTAAGVTRTITANILAGSSNCLLQNAAGCSLIVNGSVTGGSSGSAPGIDASLGALLQINGNVSGGTGPSCYGVNNTWIVNSIVIAGNVTGGTSGANSAHGISVSYAPSVTIIGNVTGGAGSSANGASLATSNGVYTITGNVTGGAGISASGVSGLGPNGTLTITGNVTGGSSSTAYGAFPSNGSLLIVNGTVTGGAGSNAFGLNAQFSGYVYVNGAVIGGSGQSSYGMQHSLGTLDRVFVATARGNNFPNDGLANANPGISAAAVGGAVTVDNFEFGTGGVPPFTCAGVNTGRYFVRAAGINYAKVYPSNAGSPQTLGEVTDYPASSDVRLGVNYASGGYVGSLAVPPPSAVAVGVPTDSTVGTAALDAETIGLAILNVSRDSEFAVNSVGSRLKNVATIDSVGQQLAAFGAGP